MSRLRTILENRWALVPFAMLGGSVVLAVVTVRAATSGQGAAVERGYYAKAVAWEEVQRQRAENDRLRWSVTGAFAPSPDDPRTPRLELAVTDKWDVPIEGAVVEVEAIPIKAVDRAATLALREGAAGRYAADLPVRMDGQWEFRVSVVRGDDRYEDSFRRVLRFGPPPGGSP